MKTQFLPLILGVSITIVLGQGCGPGEEPLPAPDWLTEALEAEGGGPRPEVREVMEREAGIWGNAQAEPLDATDAEAGWTGGLAYAARPERVAMACDGLPYLWTDPTIIRVQYDRLPCGTTLRVTNPENGVVLYGQVRDICSSCPSDLLEFSRAGLGWLCGLEWPETCATISGLLVDELQQPPVGAVAP